MQKDMRYFASELSMKPGLELNRYIFIVLKNGNQANFGLASWCRKCGNYFSKYGIIGTKCYILSMEVCTKIKEKQLIEHYEQSLLLD